MKPNIMYRAGAASAQRAPLLFVHGAFAGAWCWEEHFLPFFQRSGHDCFALDFRGHGVDTEWFSLHLLGIPNYVEDLAWALEQCPTPPVLIAHSMGGFVAQRLLRRRETRLAGLILMSPASETSHLEAALRLLQNHPLLCYKLQLVNSLPKAFWPWVMTRAEMRRLMLSEASSLETPGRLMPKMQHESVLAMVDMLWPTSLDRPDVPCPVLAMGGAEDVIVPPDLVRRTADWLQAELRIVPDMGHSMMLEDGWQSTAELISEWLNKHARSQPGSFTNLARPESSTTRELV